MPAVMSPRLPAEETERLIAIVMPEGAAPPVKFAVQELVKYLTAMGNAKPTVSVAPQQGDLYVGTLPQELGGEDRGAIESSLKGTDSDTFLIHSFGKRLVIYGNSPRAHLYGAYHYLETLGARWYFPERANEILPRAAIRLEGYDIRQVPSFRKRGIVFFSTTAGFEDLVDFAAKARLNTIALHNAGALEQQTVNASLDFAHKFAAPRGLNVEVERHFFGSSFCPDDTAALDRDKKTLRDYVGVLPAEMNDFFLWPADTYAAPCPSPQYADYTVSDFVMRFSNQMLTTLRESRQRAKFSYLSYLSTWEPPKHERPLPGLVLEWAPISQSFAHSLDDSTSQTNAEYREDFEALLKMFGGENTQVLGYWLDDTLFRRTFYGHLPYLPEAMQGDLSYYHRMGVRAITTFGLLTGRDYLRAHASPNVFLCPRLLWNVETETGEVMREFCQVYFGSESALEVYAALAEADRMVYVEKNHLQAKGLSDRAFVANVLKAMRVAQALLNSQENVEKAARAALLIDEVSSRLIGPVFSKY